MKWVSCQYHVPEGKTVSKLGGMYIGIYMIYQIGIYLYISEYIKKIMTS